MKAYAFDNAVRLFSLGHLDWEADTFKVLLATDQYEPDAARDQTRLDLQLAEVVPSGSYRIDGATLTGRTVEIDGLNRVRLYTDPFEWQRFSGTFRYAVVYAFNGSADRDYLISYTDYGDQTVRSANLALDFEDGVLTFSVATKELI